MSEAVSWRGPDGDARDGAGAGNGTGPVGGGAAARTPWGDARGVDLVAARVWRGVPYAAAPVGTLRFRAPRPPAPWAGERDCSVFGPTSPQLRAPGLRAPARRGRAPRGSEDCLYLNVWSPGPGGPPRPVLVWIHGGGFVSGAGSSFDGARLAARGDVVVVTANYRLGPFGHLALAQPGPGGADEAGGANLALLDQIAVLRWVRSAAAAFGGDPGRVTLFGESAGAMCVGALLAAPAARGLFHRAVLQSGAVQHVRDRAAGARARRRVVDLLGRRPAEASTAELVRAGEALLAETTGPGDVPGATPGAEPGAEPFLPTVDGVVLPEAPMAAIAAGSCREVPLLVTWCRDEVNLFLALAPEVIPPALEARARAALGARRWGELLALYAADRGDPAAGRSALLTDAMFGLPAIRLADAAHAAGGPVWTLRFDHVPADDPRGVMHGADLPLTWGRADAAGPHGHVAALWQDALLAFARDGDPSTEGLPAWPRYDPDRQPTLLFGATPRVVDHPGGRCHEAWAGLPLP
ncbi:carboxylesterase family protein [Frankia sp. CN6]|uniref:Carboxylic ester hydrolase n=1 Tax=Frankia nepalensis TaxID=1836974 RepID=A0A937RHB2_9ACTN|nr:carboxylesterase family protein [Frankia nepalensis]MBL7626378.1 carboxylesterase family protein [Frankia nepalensis]